MPTYLCEALRGFPQERVCREFRPPAVSRQQSGYPVQVAVAYVAAETEDRETVQGISQGSGGEDVNAP